MHGIEHDLTAWRHRHGNRFQRRGNTRLLVQNFDKPLRSPCRLRQFPTHFRQGAEGAACEHGIKHELTERTGRHRAGQHITRTEPEHRNNAGEDQENGKGR